MKLTNSFIILALSGLIMSVNAFAQSSDRYQITYIHNHKYLVVDDKQLSVGDQFDGDMEIKWEPRQFVRVKKVGSTKQEEYTLTQLGFSESKSKTLAEYLLNEKTLYTRGMSENNYYATKSYYLADSIHLPALSQPNDGFVAESVWQISDSESVVVSLKRTPDGKCYVITPAIYGDRKPRDIKIDIRERALSFDWVDNVYQGLSIFYMP
jgi:hypothetical protein